jgi:hypothetical protein
MGGRPAQFKIWEKMAVRLEIDDGVIGVEQEKGILSKAALSPSSAF